MPTFVSRPPVTLHDVALAATQLYNHFTAEAHKLSKQASSVLVPILAKLMTAPTEEERQKILDAALPQKELQTGLAMIMALGGNLLPAAELPAPDAAPLYPCQTVAPSKRSAAEVDHAAHLTACESCSAGFPCSIGNEFAARVQHDSAAELQAPELPAADQALPELPAADPIDKARRMADYSAHVKACVECRAKYFCRIGNDLRAGAW